MQEKIKLTVELSRVFASLSDVSKKALPGEMEKLLALDLVRVRALTYTRAAELLGIS